MIKRVVLIAMSSFLIAVPCSVFAGPKKLDLSLEWQLGSGKKVKKSFGAVTIKTLNRRGLWIAFRKENNQGFPGIALGGNFIFVHDPIEQMASLDLVVTLKNGKKSIVKRSILFSKSRPMGTKAATHDNIYHLLVLDDFIDENSLPKSIAKKEVPYEPWTDAFFRTHRLAMNYAVQSDIKTKEYAKAFRVKARYELPRLILVAEEWLDIPAEVQGGQKKKSGGLFGGKLDVVGDEIAGKKKIVPKKVPIYSVDILLDQIEADGKHPIGFQSARSIRNDILEGEIIFQATGGKRKVITAATVFSQMQKNMTGNKSNNRILTVDSNRTSILNKCEHLWPSVKKDIIAFLHDNPDWKVIIPETPVIFYSNNEPSYALYAWYQVHPSTGRMKGILPNSTRGAFSDELANLEKGLLEKLNKKKPIKAKGGPVKALFSQVAGMYVASAGVIDAIGLTICDPALANLSEKEWIKFLTDHSLDFCQKFLEDNAGLYDSYASQIGFWQGAMFLTYELGGAEAARQCTRKAYESFVNKAINDTKSYVEDKFKEAKKGLTKEGRKALDEVLNKHAKKLNKALKALEEVKKYHDKGAEWGKKTAEAVNRYNAAIADLKADLKKKGLL